MKHSATRTQHGVTKNEENNKDAKIGEILERKTPRRVRRLLHEKRII